jgi:putative pyruvate formate lyase activating enzyme
MSEDLRRIQQAKTHLTDCRLCPFRCGTARRHGDGVCGVGEASYVASEMLHMGEEEILRPAHAIFFSGCTARCRFCIAARYAFRPEYGVRVTAAQLADRILLRQEQGAQSICFIGGDPVPHIPLILESLHLVGARKRVPAVFNSNFYLTDLALDLLYDAIDIFLPDLKFGPGPCGDEIGGMPGYWPIVTGAIDRAWRDGQDLLVRHLLMPGHFACCTEPVLTWLARRPGLRVSLLDQYAAPVHARNGLAQKVSRQEREQAWAMAEGLDLTLMA